MAIWTPTTKTFPGNFMIIPSSKKWFFHAIFHLAFLSLYSELICSLNRLVLTDKEDAEYQSFECLIGTHDAFQLSKVMLCAFHAVWQHFKHDLHPLLPSKKAHKGKLIEHTEVGRKWAEYQYFINKSLKIII
jgi:hypothetical protein